MDAFGILGFTFGMSGLTFAIIGMTNGNAALAKVKALRQELEDRGILPAEGSPSAKGQDASGSDSD